MKKLCRAGFPDYFSSFWFRCRFPYEAVHNNNHNLHCLHVSLQEPMQHRIRRHDFTKHPFLALELCEDGTVKSTPLTHP